MLKLKKAIPYFVLLLALLATACSGKSATKNTVDIPSAQNNNGAYPAAGTPLATATLESYPPTNAAQTTPTQASYPAAGASPLTVTKPDGTTTSLDPATQLNIKHNTVKSGTTTVQGISVSAILIAAGVADYKQITITGSNGSQTLTKDKVNDNLILKVNSDGSLQLFSPDLPETAWVQAVNAIKAE